MRALGLTVRGGCNYQGRPCQGFARLLIALAMVGWGSVAAAQINQPVPVPSGAAIVLQDVITDAPGIGLTYRFRFVAPHVGGDVDFEQAQTDMQHLCDTYALARIPDLGPQPRQIVISLAERPVTFGEISPGTVQFFEAYRREGAHCLWEGF